MPTFRQMSETVSPLARSRSASRSNRATSSAVLRLLMGPSVSQSTRRLPFRLDQFLGSRPQDVRGPDALHRRPDSLQIGHVPGHEMHPGPLFRIKHQVQAMRVLLEVEYPNLVAALDEFSGRP